MSECPFCNRDPFHYVDNGLGMEAVAVTCCELGDLYFRGARKAPEEVTLSYEEFNEVGGRLARLAWLSKLIDEINAEMGIEDDGEDAIYGIVSLRHKLKAEQATLCNILQAHEMEKKVLYEALERALSHFAVMGGDHPARAAREIEELLAGVAEQSGAGAPETSVRCGASAAQGPDMTKDRATLPNITNSRDT
jgi:hypothetical protein